LDEFKHVVRSLDRNDYLNADEQLFTLIDFFENGMLDDKYVAVLLGEKYDLQKEFIQTNLKFYGVAGRYIF
jgi:hypothetical protein